MPRARQKPTYCYHRPTGQAYCRVNGKMVYLGKWDSEASRSEFATVLEEWSLRSDFGKYSIAVDDLIIRFMEHARKHYRKNGRPTSEVHCFQTALRYVVAKFGTTKAKDFGPLRLEAIRDQMVADQHCRTSVNQHCSRIRRVWKWGVSKELIPASSLTALQSVRGLEAGRTDAVEMDPVKPVPIDRVNAILDRLTEPVRGLVEFQLATGCRPSEAILLRGCDITVPDDSEAWEYRPSSHKLQHKKKPRVVYLGPKAQAIVKRFLTSDQTRFLFRPQDVRNRVKNAERQPGERYNVHAYRTAIMRACEDAFGMPKELRRFSRKVKEPERTILLRRAAEWRDANCWHPNQLRHTFATQARKTAGIETTRVLLGHAKISMSEHYAEVDAGVGREAAAAIG